MVKFAPKWIGTASAKILLKIISTGDTLQYELKGISKPPLASKHFSMNCKTKKVSSLTIPISNPYEDKDVKYRVETDIPHFFGEETLSLEAGQKANYKFSVNP